MIENADADCCRDTGAKVGSVAPASTPAVCETACDQNESCKFFSHSQSGQNCTLCSTCDLASTGNGQDYTSWKATGLLLL